MPSVEITSSWENLGLVALSSVAMLLGIITYVRIVGLRSFSKMSAFDFSVTLAIGSLLAAVSMSNSSLAEGLVAVGTLLAAQAAMAVGRRRFGLFRVVDNQPLLLMVGSEMLEDNLRRARVSPDDVRAKIRAANVVNYESLRYVVLETTGDVTVVHGEGPIEPDVLHDVVDGHRALDDG